MVVTRTASGSRSDAPTHATTVPTADGDPFASSRANITSDPSGSAHVLEEKGGVGIEAGGDDYGEKYGASTHEYDCEYDTQCDSQDDSEYEHWVHPWNGAGPEDDARIDLGRPRARRRGRRRGLGRGRERERGGRGREREREGRGRGREREGGGRGRERERGGRGRERERGGRGRGSLKDESRRSRIKRPIVSQTCERDYWYDDDDDYDIGYDYDSYEWSPHRRRSRSVSSTSDEDDSDLGINFRLAMEDVLADSGYRDGLVKHNFPNPMAGRVYREQPGWWTYIATTRELAMMWFINQVTDKHEWWRKVHDEEAVGQWKRELEDAVLMGNHPMETGFSVPMFDFCLRELRDKAVVWETMATNEDGSGGVVSVLDMETAIFKSDGRVPGSVISALRGAAKSLEGVSEDDKDWEPGTDGTMLNLVDPSLWPFVYDKTRMIKDGEMDVANALDHIGRGDSVEDNSASVSVRNSTVERDGVSSPFPEDVNFGPQTDGARRVRSHRFQWLPADVVFGPEGASKPTISSYINNIHPVRHKALYPAIEELLDASLPLLSATYHRTMTWFYRHYFWHRQGYGPYGTGAFPERTRTREFTSPVCTVPNICRQRRPPSYRRRSCRHSNMPKSLLPDGITDVEAYDITQQWFDKTHTAPLPVPFKYKFAGCGKYQTEGPWFKIARRTSIEARNKTEAGENKNARDEEGIKESPTGAQGDQSTCPDHRLQIIVKLTNIHLTPDQPSYAGGSWHFDGGINEFICATALFYYDSDNVRDGRIAFHNDTILDHYYQELGDVATPQGRLLVYPNVFQHRVGPLELEDQTRPGYQKVIALFLVDPEVRIPSSATVRPQQRHWIEDSPIDLRLPPELARAIYEHVECPFDLDEAKKLRDDLRAQPTAADNESAESDSSGYSDSTSSS